MNTITVIGRLTHEPDRKKSRQGNSNFTTFDLAVPRMKKGETDFFQCIAFSKVGENAAKYLKKGHRVAITGSMQSREWEKDGERRVGYYLIVGTMDFLETKGKKQEYRREELEDDFPY